MENPGRSAAISKLVLIALKQQGIAWLVVSGNSMRPLLKSGDRVEVHAASVSSVMAGDLVAIK